MYDMASHPIYMQNNNTKISTNREDFLNEEKDKILLNLALFIQYIEPPEKIL